MNIFIGFDFESVPIGVLLSDSREKAEIAWAAMGEMPCYVEEIDPNTAQGINGLVFLLTTIKANSRTDYSHRPFGVDFRIWRRGTV
jgi:hypothetical protein